MSNKIAVPLSIYECISVPSDKAGYQLPTFQIYEDMPAPRIEVLDEVQDWIHERRVMCRIIWSRPNDSVNIYAAYIRFDDPNLAFEFKMRWG